MRNSINITCAIATIAAASFCCASCCHTDNVPYDTAHIAEFHQLTSPSVDVDFVQNDMALFVDYSNCIANGMSSTFYQNMVSPLTAATKEYWSIKGDCIQQEEGSTYSLLNNVEEINYAALDKAISQMSNRNSESVLLTDGELFTQTSTKNNPNNPYMHEAFKNWLLKGHDIHILAEPYQEIYKGQTFNKKRFYIIFTDDRIEGNIYDRIREIVPLEQFPQVDEFHLSGNYPWVLPVNGKHSELNNSLAADISGFGTYEIQDWQLDWKNIQNLIMGGFDDQGNSLPNGEKLIGGLRINRNAFGCYKISKIGVKVSNINADYYDLYNRIESGEKVGKLELSKSLPINQFIIADASEFQKHSMVDLYFDVNNFAPDKDTELNGYPFNYFKIDIVVEELTNILGNNIDMFNFDSIVNVGQTNISISESLKNCVFDPELTNMLTGKVLYTIYVKSNNYK
jgi:hypothetical protein